MYPDPDLYGSECLGVEQELLETQERTLCVHRAALGEYVAVAGCAHARRARLEY